MVQGRSLWGVSLYLHTQIILIPTEPLLACELSNWGLYGPRQQLPGLPLEVGFLCAIRLGWRKLLMVLVLFAVLVWWIGGELRSPGLKISTFHCNTFWRGNSLLTIFFLFFLMSLVWSQIRWDSFQNFTGHAGRRHLFPAEVTLTFLSLHSKGIGQNSF